MGVRDVMPTAQHQQSPTFSPNRTVFFLHTAVLVGIASVVLTPLVVTPHTYAGFIVGKALWSRALIEVVFALWVVLALIDPAVRPRYSPLLVVFGLVVVVWILSGAFGINFQRSMWTTYRRMQGIVALLHWLAFFTVLVAVLRTQRAWFQLLGFNLIVGTAVALVVIARSLDIHLHFYGSLPEYHLPRLSGPFGNPIFMGSYLTINAVLALGFAAVVVLRGDGAARTGPSTLRWSRGTVWLLVALLHLWGVVLAASVTAFIGFFSALVFLAIGFSISAPPARRRVVLLVVLVLPAALLLAGALSVMILDVAHPLLRWANHPSVQLIDKFDLSHPTVQGRLAAWRISLEGFAERPFLGWGPENFRVVFGRFGQGYGAAMEVFGRPHNTLLEAAVTTGVVGLVAWLGLWVTTFAVLLRLMWCLNGPIRIFALFVGAALAAHFAQGMLLFDTTPTRLQQVILLAFLAALSLSSLSPGSSPTLPGPVPKRRRAAWLTLSAVLVAFSGLGLSTTITIYGVSRDLNAGIRDGSFLVDFREVTDGFAPLAGEARQILFVNAADHLEHLRTVDPARAEQFGEAVDREVEAAIAAEPFDWWVQLLIARYYNQVAAFDPSYASAATFHLARAQGLAPHREILDREPGLPSSLVIKPLAGGRLELHWKGVEGAGYHVLRQSGAPGAWRPLLYTYDDSYTGFVLPPLSGPGPHRFGIRACLHIGRCSAWVDWPPIRLPPAVTDESVQ